jgi:hypothetical protein
MTPKPWKGGSNERAISQPDPTYAVAGEGPLVVDGICGPKTQKHIRRYQERNTQVNPQSPLKQDGRIDPIRRGAHIGAAGGKVITMLALNFSYQHVRGQAAPDNITRDPVFPQELRPALAPD